MELADFGTPGIHSRISLNTIFFQFTHTRDHNYVELADFGMPGIS